MIHCQKEPCGTATDDEDGVTIEVAVIGIDGSGKSSIITQCAAYLGEDYSVVVLGWESIAYIEGKRIYNLSRQRTESFPSYLERLCFFSTRIRTAWHRLHKASLLKELGPDFCIEDRDLLLDPSILTISYLPVMREASISARVRFMQRITRGRLSEVYVYLDVSPQTAYERICLRHRHEGKKISAHENPKNLSQLSSEYKSGVAFLEKRRIAVCRVNTEERTVEECSREIVEFLRRYLRGGYGTLNPS